MVGVFPGVLGGFFEEGGELEDDGQITGDEGLIERGHKDRAEDEVGQRVFVFQIGEGLAVTLFKPG